MKAGGGLLYGVSVMHLAIRGQKGLRADEDIIINTGCLKHREGDVQCKYDVRLDREK